MIPLCPPRPYPMLTKPISLLMVDFARDGRRIVERHPYWASSVAEREAMFGPGPTRMHGQRTAAAAVTG